MPRAKNEIDIAVELRNGQRVLCEVKYRNDSELSAQDAIIAACRQGEPALWYDRRDMRTAVKVRTEPR